MSRPLPRLRTRITLYFLLLVVIWTLFVLMLLGDLLTRTSRDLFRERGAQLARTLAVECGPLVHYEEIQMLSALLAQRREAIPDIAYIVVLRQDGEVVASTFEDGPPAALLEVRHATQVDPDVAVQLIETEKQQLYDYIATNMGIRVQMGMTLLPVERFAYQVTTYVLWTGVAALLAVFAIALHVSRPVEALMAAVERAAEMSLHMGDQATTLHGTMETSALASWFEEMVKRLRLSAQRLEKSRKLAYLGEISTSIAHEINNPLGIIVLNSEFLSKRAESGDVGPAAAKEIERVRAAAMRATLAAQKLLQFARYSTRTDGVNRRRIHLTPMLKETVELLSDEVRIAQCSVSIDVSPDLPAVFVDPQGIQQVLFNLLTNALDASPKDGEVKIRALVEGGNLVLSVADQGCGMDEELLHRATEPFVTTKDTRGGTGLGLAISDSIVRSHDGELMLHSRTNEGTTVTVTLPAGVSQ